MELIQWLKDKTFPFFSPWRRSSIPFHGACTDDLLVPAPRSRATGPPGTMLAGALDEQERARTNATLLPAHAQTRRSSSPQSYARCCHFVRMLRTLLDSSTHQATAG
jgi:hypothetical protein